MVPSQSHLWVETFTATWSIRLLVEGGQLHQSQLTRHIRSLIKLNQPQTTFTATQMADVTLKDTKTERLIAGTNSMSPRESAPSPRWETVTRQAPSVLPMLRSSPLITCHSKAGDLDATNRARSPRQKTVGWRTMLAAQAKTNMRVISSMMMAAKRLTQTKPADWRKVRLTRVTKMSFALIKLQERPQLLKTSQSPKS